MTTRYKILLSAFIFLSFCSVINDFISLPSMTEQGLLFFNTNAWLSGKKLYQDIFTVQPPLIFCLYALPAYISQHVRLDEARVFTVLGLALIAYVISVALAIIRFHPEFKHAPKKRLEFCLLLVSLYVAFQTPTYFLDRDHIFFILILSYILRFMPSAAAAQIPKPLRWAIGILAAVGLCIKPQCIIIFAGVNLIFILRERSSAILRSTENTLIYLSLAAYITCIGLFTPDYITTVFPMALATYSACNERLGGLIFFSLILLSYGVTFADFRLRDTSPYRKDILYFLAVSLCFLIYALANNGWGYSWNAPETFGLLITGFVLWEHLYLKQERLKQALPVRQFIFGARACMIVFLCNCAIVVTDVFWLLPTACGIFECKNDPEFLRGIENANDYHPVSSFGTISIDFTTWPFYSRHTGAQWQTRFNHIWMLPKFFISDETFAIKNKWIIDYVGNAYAQDLATHKPQLIFVEDTEHFYSVHRYVDLLAFLESRSPAFAEAWKQYRFAGKVESGNQRASKTLHHGYYIYTRINVP